MKFVTTERAYYMALDVALGRNEGGRARIEHVADPRKDPKKDPLPEGYVFHKGGFYRDVAGVEMLSAGWDFADDDLKRLVTYGDVPQFGKPDKDGGLPEIPETTTAKEAGEALAELANSMSDEEARELLASVNKGLHYAFRKHVEPALPSERGKKQAAEIEKAKQAAIADITAKAKAALAAGDMEALKKLIGG